MIRAVIFDMDGTLLDSQKMWKKVPAIFIKEHKCIVPDSYVKKWGDKRMSEQLRALCDLNLQPKGMAFEDCLKWCLDYMDTLYFKGFPLKPGALEWVVDLKAKKIPRAIITATNLKAATEVLKITGLLEYIDFVESTFDPAFTKKSPKVFLDASKRLGSKPSECLVVEDNLDAIISAKKAGCLAWAIREDYHGDLVTSKIKEHADEYFETPKEAMLAFNTMFNAKKERGGEEISSQYSSVDL